MSAAETGVMAVLLCEGKKILGTNKVLRIYWGLTWC